MMTSQSFAELEATIEKLPPLQLFQLYLKISHLLDQTKSPVQKSTEETPEETMRIFNSFSGSVENDIDEKKERGNWRDEIFN